jgi:hypothetical protein
MGIFLAIFLLAPGNALSQSSVTGRVTEALSENPIAGAVVKLRAAEAVLATTQTDSEGKYTIVFEPSSSLDIETLIVSAVHDQFAEQYKNIETTVPEPTVVSCSFSLVPKELTACKKRKEHCVIVGHFTPPLSATYSEQYAAFSARIATALTYDLLTRLQQFHFNAVLQPEFIQCDEAKPRVPGEGKNLARALGANAFISGDVQAAGQGYDVRTYLSDPYDIFRPPFSSTNPSVDLDDPGAAQLSAETHAAILTVIAAAYEQEGNFAAGVEATYVAEGILGDVTPKLQEIRNRCKSQLPHCRFLLGGSP